MNTARIREVEGLLANQRRPARFPAPIEREFIEETHAVRARIIRDNILPSAFIYNLFVAADFILVPETAHIALALHFLVITPFIVIGGLLYDRVGSMALRTVLLGLVPVLIISQIMAIFLMNKGAGAENYQYLAIPVLIYMNVNLRFGFSFAVTTSAILIALHAAGLGISDAAWQTKVVGISFMLSAAYMTLLANWSMDRDRRTGFLRRLQERLLKESAERRALHDPLTGVANRNRLVKSAEELWRLSDEKVSPVAVVMVDIDHFKAFNDRFGHPAGDDCLKRVAGVLADSVGDDGLVARYGGEEFIVLLPETDLPKAARTAERIRIAVFDAAIPHPGAGIAGIVTASFGVASGPVSRHTLDELVAGADAALYAAKRSGRNAVWPPFGKPDELHTGPVPVRAAG